MEKYCVGCGKVRPEGCNFCTGCGRGSEEAATQMSLNMSGRYDPHVHGNVAEDGRWLWTSALIYFIIDGVFLAVFAVLLFSDVSNHEAYVWLAFSLIGVLIGVVLTWRYIRHRRWLRDATQHGTVIMGQIQMSRWSYGASWLTPLGIITGRIYRVDYTFMDEGQIKHSSAYISRFLANPGQPVAILVHNGRSAIIGGMQ